MNTDRQDETQSEARRAFLKLSAAGAVLASAACAAEAPTESASPTDADGPVSGDDIARAEKLLGLEYTNDERAQLVGEFEDRLSQIAQLRDVDKPNTLAPATVFDPRLPGKTFREQPNRVNIGPGYADDLPDADVDIAFASACQQAGWIRSRRITSARLTEIYLSRIEQHAPTLECFVTVTADLAREQAAAADAEIAAGRYRGPLHGLPYGLKDLADTAGIRTTWGAKPYRDRVPEADGAVTRLLSQAGAVLLGKTTLGAIAYGDLWFGGRTRNPWNTDEGSSGSSAGSASATTAGLCSFSIGTETLGSIVSPSDRCGATGLRPTFGRVSRAGAMALCWTLDKFGPICRHAEDTAIVLAALNGYDLDDPSSIAMGFEYDGRAGHEGMRVGFDPAWFEDAEDTHRAAFEALQDLGVELVEISTPDLPADPLFQAVVVEAAAAFEELTLSGRDDDMVWQDDPAWPNGWRAARLYSAVDYVQLDRLRRRFMIEMDARFSEVNALFGPTYAGGMVTITNFTGHPCLALRAGFAELPTRGRGGATAENPLGDAATADAPRSRVPQSATIWAPLFEEGNAIRLGRALEAALGIAGDRPAAFS